MATLKPKDTTRPKRKLKRNIPITKATKCLSLILNYKMKVLLKVSTFTTETIVEINKVKYRVTTKGGLCPETNKKSRAITFDFVRVDKTKLTEKEEKIGDEIFESIIKD